jgi:hypothetical protein
MIAALDLIILAAFPALGVWAHRCDDRPLVGLTSVATLAMVAMTAITFG